LLSLAALLVMIVLAFGSMDTSTVNTGGPRGGGSPPGASSATGDRQGDESGTGASAGGSAGTNTAARTDDRHPTDLVVSDAAAVFAAFERNEVKADSDMKNKWFAVKGRVEKIGKDIIDTPYVALNNGQQYSVFCVQCMFTKADEGLLSGLSPGQTVVIAGKCRGKMGNVLMGECWFYDEHAKDRELARQQAEAQREREKQRAEEQRQQAERRKEAEAKRKAEIEEAKWHTWTTADGKYTVEAKFLQGTGETVQLEKRDGAIIKIQKSKLCDDDQKWIRNRGWNRGDQ
jgi:hypothetical protein